MASELPVNVCVESVASTDSEAAGNIATRSCSAGSPEREQSRELRRRPSWPQARQAGRLLILERSSTYSNAEGSRRVEMFWGTEVEISSRPRVLTRSGSCKTIGVFSEASPVLRQLSAAAGQEGA
ncbi:hypothetical protein CCR75_002270 [Bremia lactucae]|uniref:Uncharacterized protein n=1 Tax=Bremia lactucae TaxID=4779 RepID=A0A976FN32_BRELC|nr:hypothetical protein CCR75_002270 [Bremia lactucae]